MSKTYQERRQARKIIAFLSAYSASPVALARVEGVYPPQGIDFKDLELRILAGRDPYGEDA